MANYIAQADVEHYLGVSLTASGIATFNFALPLMQDLIDLKCNRTWSTASNPITEQFDALSQVGAGVVSNYQFFVKVPPIAQAPANVSYPLAKGVVSVTIGTTPLDMNYVVSYDTFVKLSASFPSVFLANPLGFKMVTIVYNTDALLASGVPSPVKLAFVQWMAKLIQEAPDAGKSTSKVQTGTVIAMYVSDNLAIPKFVENILDRYRLMPLDTL